MNFKNIIIDELSKKYAIHYLSGLKSNTDLCDDSEYYKQFVNLTCIGIIEDIRSYGLEFRNLSHSGIIEQYLWHALMNSVALFTIDEYYTAYFADEHENPDLTYNDYLNNPEHSIDAAKKKEPIVIYWFKYEIGQLLKDCHFDFI